MTAEMSVQITLSLDLYIYIFIYPSAGIGRQGKLKFYWYKIVNVQIVFRIKNEGFYIIINIMDNYKNVVLYK